MARACSASGTARELGHVAAHVGVVGVVALLVAGGVVDPPERRLGIGADRGDPLPVAVVVGLVAVDQQAHEPALAPAPVDPEVLGQERADDEPGAVVHPALAPQLAHAGVDQRVAGAPLHQASNGLLGVAPPDRAAVAVLELRARVAGEVEEDVVVEVAPAELAAKRLGPLAARQALLDLRGPRCSRSAGRGRGARCGRGRARRGSRCTRAPARRGSGRAPARASARRRGRVADLLGEPERRRATGSGPWRGSTGAAAARAGPRAPRRRGASSQVR